ncbi:MAG TPA: DUF4919 domain-containing protein [Xanthobacteraceae bacterium]|nr:DUF4919 domain-containing protein [Xanthobacteraceae bacterium]
MHYALKVGLFFVCALAIEPAAASADDGALAGAYQKLVAQAEAGRPVDFRALREAYASSPNYDPYGLKTTGLRGAMLQAFAEHDCGEAVARAKAVIDLDFVQIDAHLVSALCYGNSGNAVAERRERTIAEGLVVSILDSRDGRSPQTAFDVVAIDEEYAILNVLQLDRKMQTLIDQDGHSYDRFDAIVKKTGEKETVFFNIDRLVHYFGRERRSGEK